VTAHADRLLLGPGPSNPYPEAIEALSRPVLGHLDPDYLALMAEIADRLRSVFGTANELTLPVSGTGSAGMEACLASLLQTGETAIIGVNGYFGERLCEVASRGGAQVVDRAYPRSSVGAIEELYGITLDDEPEPEPHRPRDRLKAKPG